MGAAANDLTTRAALKAYLGTIQTTDADPVLDRLVTAASTAIQRYCNRDIKSAPYMETRSGNGGQMLVLRRYPVTAIASLVVDDLPIPKQTKAREPGWVLEPARTLHLYGYTFTRGPANVVVSYTAGYATVPADIEQAALELAALMWKQRSRIGDQSKTVSTPMGNETVAYYMQSMTPATKAILDQFKDVVPFCFE